MKILILMNGWATKAGGGDYHILNVSKQWSSHSVEFLMPSLGVDYAKELLKGRKYHAYSTSLERANKNLLVMVLLYMLRTLKTLTLKFNNYDIIVSSSQAFYDVVPGLVYKALYGGKLVVYAHGPLFFRPRKVRHILLMLHNAVMLILMKAASDKVFVVNKEVKRALMAFGIDEEKIFMTTNGVNVEEIPKKALKKEYDACFIGRFIDTKGVMDIPKIWASVCETVPNATLVVIGDGPKKADLLKDIGRLGLGRNIKVFGHVTEKRKYELLKQSKMFLFPSYRESWGIVVAEALACGLPVVAYDLKDYAIFENDLHTAPIGDVMGMSNTAVMILSNYHKFAALGRAEYWMRKLDWRNIGRRQLEVLEGMTRRRMK